MPLPSIVFAISAVVEALAIGVFGAVESARPHPAQSGTYYVVVHAQGRPLLFLIYPVVVYWVFAARRYTLDTKLGLAYFCLTIVTLNVGLVAQIAVATSAVESAVANGFGPPKTQALALLRSSSIAYDLLVASQLILIYNIVRTIMRRAERRKLPS